jgi:hypothetical protein
MTSLMNEVVQKMDMAYKKEQRVKKRLKQVRKCVSREITQQSTNPTTRIADNITWIWNG